MNPRPALHPYVLQLSRKLGRLKRQPLPCAVNARRIYVLPTGVGLFFATLVLVMSLGALNYGNNPALLLALLLAGAGLASALSAHLQLSGVVVAGIQAAPVRAGEPAQVHIQLEHADPRRREGLRVQWDDGAADTAAPATTADSHQLQAICSLPAVRRGLHPLPPLTLSTTQPLGLVLAWTRLHPHRQYLVYPAAEHNGPPLPTPPSASGNRPDQAGEDDLLRDYRPGDSRARIAWKASAHRQSLLVRQPTGGGPTPLALDWQQLGHLAYEARISRLAHWVELAAHSQRRWSLQLPGQPALGPGSGHDHLQACLRALALMPDER